MQMHAEIWGLNIQENIWNPGLIIIFSLATGFLTKSSLMLSLPSGHWGNKGFPGFFQAAVFPSEVFPDSGMSVTLHCNDLFSYLSLPYDYGTLR